jgi:hypothetical protein
MNGRYSDMSDEALGRQLATDLPRYRAPASLRARVQTAGRPVRRPRNWLAPTLSALATAAVLVLALLPTMPRTTPTDAVHRLVNVVVAEHTRTLLWGARRPDVIPVAAEEANLQLARAFAGDDRLTFVAAEPVYLDWRRGIALHYRDADGHDVTYVALPVPGIPMPERLRVAIHTPERTFRPALVKTSGFAAWVWPQNDLLCFIVSDLVAESDLAAFKDYFVRLRTGTEPRPVL